MRPLHRLHPLAYHTDPFCGRAMARPYTAGTLSCFPPLPCPFIQWFLGQSPPRQPDDAVGIRQR